MRIQFFNCSKLLGWSEYTPVANLEHSFGRKIFTSIPFFYYASNRSLLLGPPFQYVFSISMVLSLLPIDALSFSLVGGDWGSAILGLVTFRYDMWQSDGHSVSDGTHTFVVWLGRGSRYTSAI